MILKRIPAFLSSFLSLALFVSLFLLSACGEQEGDRQNKPKQETKQPEEAGLSPNQSGSPKMRALVDQLRVRSAPDLEAEVIGVLHEGETMTYVGEDSEEEIEVTLRGKKVKAPFKKVVINNGKTGWVFGGAVAPASSELNKPSAEVSLKDYLELLGGLDKKKGDNLRLAAEELKKRFASDAPKADEAISAYIEWSREAIFAVNDEFLGRKDLDQFDLIVWNPDKKELPAPVKKMQDEIKDQGLRFITPEGMVQLDIAPGYWENKFAGVATPAMKKYLKQCSLEQKEGFAEDAGLVITPFQLSQRLIFWEKFQKEHSDFVMKEDVQYKLDDYLSIFVTGLDNTPYCTFNEGNPIDPAFHKAYDGFIKTAPEGKCKKVIKGWFELLRKRDFKAGKEPALLASQYLESQGA